MIIPTGCNWMEFYKAAKKKGIAITSRFQGIYLSDGNGHPKWMARYQGAGKSVFLGRFPFTEQGEIAARKKYALYLLENGLTERYPEKRKYKKQKP